MKPPAAWRDAAASWPNAAHSEFLRVGRQDWHLQQMGQGQTLVLLHGAGAATHSWGALAPLLAQDFHVVAPDLPGHGFSGPGAHMTLPAVAAAVAALLDALDVEPALVVGHSAGAAILAQLCLDRTLHPSGLVSINGALLPFGGALGPLFSQAARVLAGLPALPRFLARQARRPGAVERLIRRTGSAPETAATAHYRTLVSRPTHVTATLQMMASWDLQQLYAALPGLPVPLLLLACEGDEAVPPVQARQLARHVPGAELELLPGLGHLGHEEAPARFQALITRFAAAQRDRDKDAGQPA